MKAAVRGDHIGALATFEQPPVGVQSALGLHAAVLSRNERQTLADQISTAIASAEMGAPETAVEVAEAHADKLPARDKARLALAIARWTPDAARRLMPESASLLRSALALREGRTDLAAEMLSGATPGFDGDRQIIAANIAASRGNYRAARQAANAAFRHFGLQGPLDERSDTVIDLASFGGRNLAPAAAAAPAGAPVVTIVMPARNAEATVAVAIRSVLAQTWTAIELIVVDDASTDATPSAIAAAIAGDTRARSVRRDVRGGAYGARNTGLTMATGTFITFNDADDWSHPDRIARGLAPLLATPALMATQSRLVRLDRQGRFTATRVFPFIRANPSSLIFRRREVLDALGCFDAVSVGADEEFAARLTACFGVDALLRLPILLMVAGDSAGSLTGSAETGINSIDGIRRRVLYREAWHARHVEIYRAQQRRADADQSADGMVWRLPLADRATQQRSPESRDAGS